MEAKLREREATLDTITRSIKEKEGFLRQLKMEEEQGVRQSEAVKASLEKQLDNRSEQISKNEDKLRAITSELTDLTERRQKAERDLSDTLRSVQSNKDSLLAVQREREAAEGDLKSTTGKVRQVQAKLATIKTELDALVSEREKQKGELSVQERHVENLTTELAALKEKKDRRKEKLRILQEESETIERTVREAKLSNLSNNNRKSELISEVKGLQNKERECLMRVEQISTELARAEEQKQVESAKLAELQETIRVLEDKRKDMGELCVNEEKKMREEMLELDRERKQLEEDVKHLKTERCRYPLKGSWLREKRGRDVPNKGVMITVIISGEGKELREVLRELEEQRENATKQLNDQLSQAIKERNKIAGTIQGRELVSSIMPDRDE
eukprot:sb/3465560/